MMWLMLNKSFQESGVHLTITMQRMKGERDHVFFFSLQEVGVGGWNTITTHIRINEYV